MHEHVIEFSDYGTDLGARFTGAAIREKILDAFKDGKKVIFDFTGVDSISEQFADECFSKLLESFNLNDIKEKTAYKDANPFIRVAIDKANKEKLHILERPEEFFYLS